MRDIAGAAMIRHENASALRRSIGFPMRFRLCKLSEQTFEVHESLAFWIFSKEMLEGTPDWRIGAARA